MNETASYALDGFSYLHKLFPDKKQSPDLWAFKLINKGNDSEQHIFILVELKCELTVELESWCNNMPTHFSFYDSFSIW